MAKADQWTLPKGALETLADSEAAAVVVRPARRERKPPKPKRAHGAGSVAPPSTQGDVGAQEPINFWERADLPIVPLPSVDDGLEASALWRSGTLAVLEEAANAARQTADRSTSTVPTMDRAPRSRDLESPETGPAHNPLGDDLDEVKFRVHRRLIASLETRRLDTMRPQELWAEVERATREILQSEAPEIRGAQRDQLVSAIMDEVLGFGPIEPLLRDPSISEVMVNAPDAVYFERSGRLSRSGIHFRDVAHIRRIVDRMLAPMGRRVDEASPMVDARLADGSRVNVIIPPVSLKGPVITIRKFTADMMRMQDLVGSGTLTEETAMFLAACVAIRRNMIISGGTGSGKTTLLNALSASIGQKERIVTIEDPAELRLQQPHVISLEARLPSIEGTGEITSRHLLRNALRMRPDRIIVGECRGTEAFDMLQAMNTGHEGSLSTVHANSPRDAISRIESMVLMTGLDLPLVVIRQQIASSINVIVQVARFRDGSRKVVEISELTGMEGNVITMETIFKFENQGIDEQQRVLGKLQAQGLRPTFAPEFALAGITLPPDLFVQYGDL